MNKKFYGIVERIAISTGVGNKMFNRMMKIAFSATVAHALIEQTLISPDIEGCPFLQEIGLYDKYSKTYKKFKGDHTYGISIHPIIVLNSMLNEEELGSFEYEMLSLLDSWGNDLHYYLHERLYADKFAGSIYGSPEALIAMPKGMDADVVEACLKAEHFRSIITKALSDVIDDEDKAVIDWMLQESIPTIEQTPAIVKSNKIRKLHK